MIASVVLGVLEMYIEENIQNRLAISQSSRFFLLNPGRGISKRERHVAPSIGRFYLCRPIVWSFYLL